MAMSSWFVLSKHPCAMCLLARDRWPLRSSSAIRQPALPSQTMLFYIFFLLHLSDFQPLARYSPPSATKRAEHTESPLIRAFSPSLRPPPPPPSGNRFARRSAGPRKLLPPPQTPLHPRCSSSTAEDQKKVDASTVMPASLLFKLKRRVFHQN